MGRIHENTVGISHDYPIDSGDVKTVSLRGDTGDHPWG
jgi:hypothetical protein